MIYVQLIVPNWRTFKLGLPRLRQSTFDSNVFAIQNIKTDKINGQWRHTRICVRPTWIRTHIHQSETHKVSQLDKEYLRQSSLHWWILIRKPRARYLKLNSNVTESTSETMSRPRPPDNQKNSFKALLGRIEAKDEVKTLTHPRWQKSNSMGFDKKRRQSYKNRFLGPSVSSNDRAEQKYTWR